VNLQEKILKFIRKTSDYLYQKNFLAGTRRYTKFIILGTGRTGSNMLLSALGQHSNAVVYGEIFNNTRHDRLGYNNKFYLPYISYQTALKIREDFPIRFLEDHIFRVFHRDTAAVGFKFFYWHCQEDHWRCVWDYLKEKKEIKIIHIKRKNKLRTLVSLKLAQQSKQWSQKHLGEKKKQGAVSLDFDKCLEVFNDWSEKETFYDNYFADHPMHEVTYENLCEKYEKEMENIQWFLGLKPFRLMPLTVKQGGRRLDNVIANYAELKEQFEHTEWKHFFED
jgi:LPS sulfotransferase NodH